MYESTDSVLTLNKDADFEGEMLGSAGEREGERASYILALNSLVRAETTLSMFEANWIVWYLKEELSNWNWRDRQLILDSGGESVS